MERPTTVYLIEETIVMNNGKEKSIVCVSLSLEEANKRVDYMNNNAKLGFLMENEGSVFYKAIPAPTDVRSSWLVNLPEPKEVI